MANLGFIRTKMAPSTSGRLRIFSRASKRYSLASFAMAAALVGCSHDESSPPGAEATGVTFQSYADANPFDASAALPLALSGDELSEVASRSRQWATETLITRDAGFTANAVAIPPLYFARAEAVAAAASGTTLEQIRGEVPAPSSPAVGAALMAGIARTISARADSPVEPTFMDAVSAHDWPGIWAAFELKPLSESAVAENPKLRMRIDDEFTVNASWPAAEAFDGVFAAESGSRVLAPLVRITGAWQLPIDAGVEAITLELPNQRWLVRITPSTGLRSWSISDLGGVLEQVTSAVTTPPSQAWSQADLVLPITTEFMALGADDWRGMDYARNSALADLRGLDGRGGDYVDFPSHYATLNIGADGIKVWGASVTRFIFNPDNQSTAGTVFENGVVEYPVACAETDLHPAYLAIINPYQGIEMLARFTYTDGVPCE